MSETTITVSGNLTADPKIHYNAKGQPVAGFTIASSRRVRDEDGEITATEPVFIDVVAWRHLAEHAAESLRRGDRVIATGHLRRHSWETTDGDKRHTTELHADDIGASIRYANVSIRKPKPTNPAAAAVLGTSEETA